MCSSLEIKVRPLTIDDKSSLLNLIALSKGDESKINDSVLTDNFFEFGNEQEIKSIDQNVEFEVSKIKTNKPVAQALIAEVNSSLAGYLIYHYHYSPWYGHCGFIDDIYILSAYRKRGVARQLLRKWTGQAKRDGLKAILFTDRDRSPELMKYLFENGFMWYRNNAMDWSVSRINLN